MALFLDKSEEYLCPTCASPITWEPDCPGYPSTSSVMVCQPPCGGAVLLECASRACPWWYREPNNRTTRGYKLGLGQVEMGIRPDWFDNWYKDYYGETEDEDEESE